MRIAQALQGIERLYIETAPLIYYVEENPTYLARMDPIVEAVDEGQLKAYSSVITLTEVLSLPIKTGDKRLEQEYRDILVNSASYQLLPVNVQIAEGAAELRAKYNLRAPDVLHVAYAIHRRCDAFLTNDSGIKRVTDLTILILDELRL